MIMSTEVNRRSLQADCKNCFGFCCVALCFSASEGFPVNKDADMPCPNLQSDFRCIHHESLRELGLKGCTAYDCFGAGQKVAQVTYAKRDWRQYPESAKQMFRVFLIMRQLHEMLWYISEALALQPACSIHSELHAKFYDIENLTLLSPDSLVKVNVADFRSDVNDLLLKTSEMVRNSVRLGQKSRSSHRKTRALDFIGADLRKKDLKGENFRGAYLIAADLRGADLSGVDFIGADFRDADLRGADLSNSIFLTQAQVNSAKGDASTKLPKSLTSPEFW